MEVPNEQEEGEVLHNEDVVHEVKGEQFHNKDPEANRPKVKGVGHNRVVHHLAILESYIDLNLEVEDSSSPVVHSNPSREVVGSSSVNTEVVVAALVIDVHRHSRLKIGCLLQNVHRGDLLHVHDLPIRRVRVKDHLLVLHSSFAQHS